uniref:RNA helicase n=1 Tax=Elaeophora elaphi TaxID=1147741 RepID=A0A0R3S5C5_9BILA
MENIMELERGCNMLFATMGRLMHFVERKKVKLHNIRFFVLDEADRMLDQNTFQTGIMSLIHSPAFPSVKDRQTLLFSATFTREVQELVAQVLKKDHAFVSNGKITAANPLVEQNFIEVTSENKFDKLIQLLEEDKANNGDVSRTLVFVQRKQMADVIALNLVQKNIRSSSISGDRLQKQREEALADFRKGNINVLVATDVCARGIDVKDLQHVINYDMPNDRVTYVHRIGRTGRLHRGKATSFINVADQDPTLIIDIVQVVREAQQIPPDFLLDIANNRRIPLHGESMYALESSF